ncbi:MAG: hypothetical protein ACU843_16835, partial [Gammaproteobacteria bacterium]
MERFSMAYLYQSELERIYSKKNAGIFAGCRQIAETHCHEFADLFYESLMTDAIARTFLDTTKVEQRLKHTLQ